jgi:hypothetical protein
LCNNAQPFLFYKSWFTFARANALEASWFWTDGVQGLVVDGLLKVFQQC